MEILYLLNLEKDNNLNLYFSLKNKHNLSIKEKEKDEFIFKIRNEIKKHVKNIDLIIFPESKSNFLKNVIGSLKIEHLELKKNSKEFIQERLVEMDFSKQEMKSQLIRLKKMGSTFQIHKIKSNQRKKYYPYLFKKTNANLENKKIIFIDDSIFSGSTLKSAKFTINSIEKSLFIFKN